MKRKRYTRLVAIITTAAIVASTKAITVAAHTKKQRRRIERFLNYMRIKLEKKSEFILSIILIFIEKISIKI
jgi:hypothetical protein